MKELTTEEKLEGLRYAVQCIIDYPKEGHPRRTPDGYPSEIKYDKFAYNRICDSYREGLAEILEHYK